MTTSGNARLRDDAVRPLRTLDPAAPLGDLKWLDDAIGNARVVAIGEPAHFNHEFYRLRHRLLRYLVERHGFGAYAMESGFTEGWLVDGWVRGGEDRLGRVLATGMTSLMGMCTEMRDQLNWMRQHNLESARPVGFYGADLSGSNISLLPSLDAVLAYLTRADPDIAVDPAIRETAAAFAAPSIFSLATAIGAYTELEPARRDALTAGLTRLSTRLVARRLDYVRRTGTADYERALHALRLTITLDAVVRAMTRGDQQDVANFRDAAMADTVDWILRREDRMVLAAHNGHLQRYPLTMPGIPTATPLGMHLADRLGDDYLVIGATTATGRTLNTGNDFHTGTFFTDLQPPETGSLDALMSATHDGPFAIDLRTLSPEDSAAVGATTRYRMGNWYLDVNPVQAFDIVIHLPSATPAEPDPEAIAEAPQEVQQPFSAWRARRDGRHIA
ncbi:erythromycin esterase family protein [Nocardia transvalensis]|uniref:erythromycin esterase family protein n=1 Tax=Nocardia transvalensis TaxID=37333 RepID=UPI001895BEF3|nr:erythromycin esterase family protein [Nocardia transvalensis]MBF6327246.1 erythromycin esterase family protein [Nocardia transvalensis]